MSVISFDELEVCRDCGVVKWKKVICASCEKKARQNKLAEEISALRKRVDFLVENLKKG